MKSWRVRTERPGERVSGAAELAGSQTPVRLEKIEDGQVWQVTLAAPKANVIDSAMIRGLTSVFEEARNATALKAIILQGEGKHFSFGASVEEHLPKAVKGMLQSFHRLFGAMLDAAVPILAAVRGQCLGGGLELVAFCHRVFCRPDAKLGQPEIALGVFAPVASVILSERTGRAAAEDLCLSGRVVSGDDAHALGLVDVLADDPGAEALAYIRTHLLPRSASSLRMATRALRLGFAVRFRRELRDTETLYLDELMRTDDAVEGLRSFVEKRQPQWSNA
jgi:cyclohexa-1,5-dienecarbonyl-CoA hydratase